jgi:hypothetical protein
MSIEQIVQSWKSDEKGLVGNAPESPVGEELSEESLEQVVGGLGCMITCNEEWTCSVSCFFLSSYFGE